MRSVSACYFVSKGRMVSASTSINLPPSHVHTQIHWIAVWFLLKDDFSHESCDLKSHIKPAETEARLKNVIIQFLP
jgi:hypothetical protein